MSLRWQSLLHREQRPNVAVGLFSKTTGQTNGYR
jgi:hypothetical protein